MIKMHIAMHAIVHRFKRLPIALYTFPVLTYCRIERFLLSLVEIAQGKQQKIGAYE